MNAFDDQNVTLAEQATALKRRSEYPVWKAFARCLAAERDDIQAKVNSLKTKGDDLLEARAKLYVMNDILGDACERFHGALVAEMEALDAKAKRK